MAPFGERLKKYRNEKRMTQQELADLLGVSNKTISRWESDGGYPDVALLVPLARTLGVTVDELLDGERPVRTLTRTDWQSLLSFAFALGGGVLFFLFDLFMPVTVCWLAYLGCMAYGVWLQKYYSYKSRWFFLSNAIMNLSVNFAVAGKVVPWILTLRTTVAPTITELNMDDFGVRILWWLAFNQLLVKAIAFLFALVVTAATQHVVFHWSRGTLHRQIGTGYHLRLGAPKPWRKTAILLIPLAYVAFWRCYSGEEGGAEWLFRYQKPMFAVLVAVSILVVLLLFRKKEWKLWRVSGLLFGVICACSWWMANGNMMYWTVKGEIFTYREVTGYQENYLRFSSCRPELLIYLGALAAIWLLICLIRVERKKVEE